MNLDHIKKATTTVTKKWTKQRKREERNTRTRFSRREYIYSSRIDQTDVADDVIPRAYAKASDNGRLPAHARQIFYAARSEIQDRTGRPLSSVYFTQTLLPQFMNRHSTTHWKVVYDPRGNLWEPHTKHGVPLGTLEVDDYLNDINSHAVSDLKVDGWEKFEYPTKGPGDRYSAILFIEKEGFNPLFRESKLAERYDLAIMSTKGQSVVAARRLVDELCGVGGDVPVLVLHDLDKEGFLISQRLTTVSGEAEYTDRVRYEFQNEINVIDIGLRLVDAEKWGLESESVKFKGGFASDTITTAEEQAFLRGDERVELNAFTSGDFITYIEEKLEEHGIAKIVPNSDTLNQAFRRAYQTAAINAGIEELYQEAGQVAEEAALPCNLSAQIRARLKDNPAAPWDRIVAEIANQRFNGLNEMTF